MNIKLFDSELKVMEILWEQGDTTAKEIAEILGKEITWGKTTTYTVIKKCIDKGAIEKNDPNYVCHPLVSREQARELETTELVNKMFGGSSDQLIAALLGRKNLTSQEIEKLRQLVNEME